MDYNDWLWQKAMNELREEVNKMGPTFSMSIVGKTLTVSDEAILKREEMLRNLDENKGSPPAQLANLIAQKTNSLMETVEGSIGWPDVIKNYDQVQVRVSIHASSPAEDEEEDVLEIILDDDEDPITVRSSWL